MTSPVVQSGRGRRSGLRAHGSGLLAGRGGGGRGGGEDAAGHEARAGGAGQAEQVAPRRRVRHGKPSWAEASPATCRGGRGVRAGAGFPRAREPGRVGRPAANDQSRREERHETLIRTRHLRARHPCAARGDRQALRGAVGQSARGRAHEAAVHRCEPEIQGADPGARRRLGADRVPRHRLLAGPHQSRPEAAARRVRRSGAGDGGDGLRGRHRPHAGVFPAVPPLQLRAQREPTRTR